ncbi:Imm52 family immunity protein [Stenotrophomonas sp.]|uniref:Imm52 family immunity protein n=1 Tax=Stenotrophomonas sp. TaxID=69392 RepID=UPI0028AB1991|nr:Imm52 family immunity protein [Stenotrophomonas sp.]
MNITLACYSLPNYFAAAQAWEDASEWVARIANTHPDFETWWTVPRGPRDDAIPLSQRGHVVAHIQKANTQMVQEFLGSAGEGSVGIHLTNAATDAEWMKRGKVSLAIHPGSGILRLRLGRIEEIYPSPTTLIWKLLQGLTSESRVTFAQTNVLQQVAGSVMTYSGDRRVFHHREYLGWMGYVHAPLSADQLPHAARLERQGRGTLILAADVLDLGDHAAVEQANRTEIGLVDLGLLPVIDSSLM